MNKGKSILNWIKSEFNPVNDLNHIQQLEYVKNNGSSRELLYLLHYYHVKHLARGGALGTLIEYADLAINNNDIDKEVILSCAVIDLLQYVTRQISAVTRKE